MNTMLKRIVSMFLCFVLVAGYLPAGALAAETEETVVTAAAEATNAPSVVELSDEATGVVEEEAAEAEENEEESLTADTGDPEEAVSEENTSEEAPAEEETSDEVTSEEETSEEETSEEATEEAAAFVLEAAPVDVSLLDAEAPEHVDAAIFFSDLHTNKSDYKETTVKGIMNGLKSSNLNFSSVTSCGDAFSVNEDSGKYTGDPSKITGYIRSVFADIPVSYVWSDHDRYAGLDNDSGFIYGAGADGNYGTADDGNYYIYELSMADLSTNNRYKADFHSDAEVTATIAAFVEDAAKLDQTKPLFIASHQPLLDRRNDNGHALEWATAINEVAEDMDVAFFFGHNHKYDESGDYYYAKGSTMSVCKDKNGNAENVKLNFTHLCTGYMEPTSTGSYSSSGTRLGVAVAVTIFEDSISYVTYDKNGVYNGSYALNETVTRDHAQAEDPGNSDETTEVKTDEATGITVAAPGITGLTASVLTAETGLADAQAAVSSVISGNVVAYDIRVEGFVNNSGTKASVTIPIPSDMAADKFVVYHVAENGEIEEMPGEASGQTYTFETDHFSVYVGGEKVSDNTQVDGTYTGTGNLSGSAVYSLATSIDTSKDYLIANGKANSVQLLTNNNGEVDTTAATVSDSKITIANDANVAWTFSGTNTGTIKNNDHYVVLNSDDILNKTYQNLTIDRQTSGAYRISQKPDRTTYYLRYDRGWSRSSRTAMDLYLFEKTSTNPGTSVTFTLEAPAALTTNDTTYDLTYKIELGQGTVSSQEITWTSDNNEVVTVANGVLTVTGEGTANIKAKLTRVNGTGLVKAIEVSVPVTVAAKQITSIAVPSPITVFVGTSASTKVADITVTYDDGSTTKVPLTLSMLRGSYNTDEVGSYKGLTVGYGEKTATVTLVVKEKVVNNYPEYPDEGAVKVSKTGTGIDFQSSGIAQVEIAASGVPVKKGADVIVMLDTSSSMTKNTVEGSGGKMRSEVLEESLENLIAYFKTPGEDGEPMDLRVAIADFNGYYGHNSNGTSNTPYDRTKGDYVRSGNSEGSGYQQPSEAQVYTGSKALDKGAFINAAELSNSYTLNYTSGTNYDYAFDAIFQLGTAIKTEDRDLYVIFMSDGASLQWNYFGTQNGYTKWNNWLAGTWDADDLTTSNLNSTAHSYFYDLNDHDGDGHINEHRMANAIKGDPTVDYEIIRKSEDGLPAGTLTKVNGKEYLYTVKGLGATMFTINFDAQQDGQITEASIDKALASTASDQTGTTKYYYKVTTAAELENAFDAIGSEIAYAAYNARFVDQMGANYNLQMKTSTYKLKDNSSKTLEPKIEIISYDIYTRQEYLDGKITADKIGDRKDTFKILETVTFNADGTEAYSDQIGEGVNILADGTEEGFVKGVIYANTFLYNTNQNAVAVNGVNIPTGKDSANLTTGGTNVLPAETFYWKMGTVQSKELAMRYHVYLEGSMEGTREAGSYPTNEFATLYYDNYVHKPCYKETVSPVLAWKEANVSYAFYLVNENGEIIVNQTTGETGSFANKIAVTNPAVYKQIKLNNVDTLDIASLNVVPDGYKLYDANYDNNGNATKGATYTVTINSNTTGKWDITSVKGDQTTYVMQYDPSNSAAYSNKTEESSNTLDYTHTVVWFAVVWTVGAYPDSVVIDYGLPVEISVLTNDMFGDYGSLAGVGDYNTEGLTETGHTPSNVLSSQNYTGTFGTATANAATGKIRYELNKSNGMQMNTYEKFGYAVNYIGSNAGYYYSSVTVIPATTIYYEDSFLTYESFTWDNGTNGWVSSETSLWSTAGNVNDNATQAEDRPGKYALQDANNIYGYDNVNLKMTQYSLGSAAKATVDYDNYAQASFTFCGTGFDVISMTSNMTGLILVDVQKYENNQWTNFAKYTVDTYYGYKQISGDADKDGQIEEGELVWAVDPDANGSLYQVPVIKMANKPYGQYRVTIKATYEPSLDHVESSESYDFYLDAIRIYDPANDGAADGTTDKTVENAYVADGEGWPSYIELRNNLIAANNFNATVGENTVVTGAVFIDGDADVKNNQIADYISYGPNNEVYLKKGQSVAFILDLPGNIANVHIGIKSADGNPCTYTVANYAQNADSENGVAAGQKYHERTSTVNTTTDMYYDLTDWRNDIIVITNNGDGILSLTNIKSTYKSDPNGNETQNVDEPDNNENGIAPASFEEELSGETQMYMTTRAAALTLRTMNAPAEEEIPEPSVPETTVPEETKPAEPTIPEETKPVKPDNSELKAAVEAARKIKQKGHTQASFKKLQTAIKAAEKVLKDKKATQAQIDKALDDLNAAVDGLETVAVNPIKPKPGGSNGKIKNNFKTMDSIADVLRNFLKGIKR